MFSLNFFSYTVLTILAVIIVLILDWFVLKYKVTLKKEYWIFTLFMFIGHTIVDNYLNGRWGFGGFIVGNYNFYSRIDVFFTPIENYFFGFALILLNILVFKFLSKFKS